ncbi:MAG: arsenite methyltransferase [Desulfofustis sp.]|nr:arsenite methyltransferase [Desulfofustis sp.]
MKGEKEEQIRQKVREHYGKVATGGKGCGCEPQSSGTCCSPNQAAGDQAGALMGYTSTDLESIVEGAKMNLGCGNPIAIAALQPGETVLDLGCGAGFDSFLAARAVGPEGRVIGVDMTAEMVAKARTNAESMRAENVSFRLGEIEHLPVSDASIDVILSNCVINLSPDKKQVWRETYRVLRPGGRLAISDIVALKPLPGDMQEQVAFYTGCVAGAAEVDPIEADLAASGFNEVAVRLRPESRQMIGQWFPGSGVEEYVASAEIEAIKPFVYLQVPEGTEWIAEVRTKAENYMKNHGNCAQSIVAAFSEVFGIDDPLVLKASSGFLGGMMHSLTCGVHTGGVMVMGLVLGRERLEDGTDGLYQIVISTQEMIRRLNDRLGSHSCQELTGVDFTDLRQAAIFSRSDEHQKCFSRVADGAEVIATLISELRNQGELKL